MCMKEIVCAKRNNIVTAAHKNNIKADSAGDALDIVECWQWNGCLVS